MYTYSAIVCHLHLRFITWKMPIPLTADVRWRIVLLYHYKEYSNQDIADLLYIHVTTVRRIITQFDTYGDVAPVSYKLGTNCMLGQQDEDTIIESLMYNPAMYLDELQQELHQSTGTWTSISTIFRIIHCHGFTRKMLRHVAMKQSDDKRVEFMEEMNYISANMIVWLDETGSDRRNECRKRRYHLRGMTPTDFKFTVRGKHLLSIGIMSARGVEEVDTYEGNINGDKFCDFIERCLVPILQSFNGTNNRSIVVMDNASIYHVNKVVTTIQNTGTLLRFLPSYSPDFNPIEELFSKFKALGNFSLGLCLGFLAGGLSSESESIQTIGLALDLGDNP